jgi:Flp pilus assembly protein TadG
MQLRWSHHPPRRGTVTVECAVVYPVTFFLLLALLIGGMGVFRYQQVASLAREGARWASVHSSDYARETGNSPATQESIRNEILSRSAGVLDPNQLTVTVTWIDENYPTRVTTNNGAARSNRVRVTVTYQWVPELYLGGITLTSTSEAIILY